MEYYKKNGPLGTYFYAKDNLNLHIFNPSVTNNSVWNYTFQTGTSQILDLILAGATAANRNELDAAIGQIETTLSGL